MRSLGSGEPECPDGTFAAGSTMDAWERWQIVCLAALSVEDIEDIYLFGTMITGILLIGLGFALSYRKIRKREQLSKAPQGCPYDWSSGKSGQHWDWDYQSQYGFYQGEALGFTKENVLYWRPKWTERVAWKIGMRLLAPKTKQSYLFLAPLQWPWQGCCWNLPRESNAVRRSCFLPHPTDITDIAPPPTTRLRSLWTASLSSGSDQRRISGCGTGWLRIHFPCVYGVCAFVLLRCFSCSHTVLPKEHSLGVIFFSSLSSCYAVFFFNSTCISLLIILCMIVYVTNNKEPWTLPLGNI